MYQHFFNFSTAPFSIAPDPRFIYMSEQHQEGLAHLMYGINQGGGFVALTGEVGTGKTTLCNCLLEKLPDNVDIALLLNPKVNAIELLATICDELDINYNQDEQTLKGLVDNLNKHLLATHASGKQTILVIDEAQNLSLDVLEQVRLLTNLETNTTKLLQIILIGQPELQQLLEKPSLRQLNQRITARYHLTKLTYSDTREYIKHRLRLCGGNISIFNQRAVKKIYKLSKGIPRLINVICDRALLGAYVNNSQVVTVPIINKAAKEIFSSEKSVDKTLMLASLAVLALAGLSYFLMAEKPQPQHVAVKKEFKPLVKKIVKPKAAIKVKKAAIKKVAKVEVLDFNTFLETHNASLEMTVPQLAGLWDKNLAQVVGCKDLKVSGLYCLFEKSNWNNLKALNRPVIMEFTLSKSKKVYALLSRLEQGNPVFFIDKETTFPLEQILSQWNGYYLTLWKPPFPTVTTAFPKATSNAVLWVRERLATDNNDLAVATSAAYFDNALKKAVMEFQQNSHLHADGIVGPRTFIHLKNTNPLDTSPKLRSTN